MRRREAIPALPLAVASLSIGGAAVWAATEADRHEEALREIAALSHFEDIEVAKDIAEAALAGEPNPHPRPTED